MKIPSKNKPNSNPIQSQSNPILAQKSGGQSQTNPIQNVSIVYPRVLPTWLTTGEWVLTCFSVGEPIQIQLHERPKMMQNLYLHRNMNENKISGFMKTKPIKPNSQSSIVNNQLSTCAIGIITNHLAGKHNLNG